MRRFAIAVLLLVTIAACDKSPTSPDEASLPHGRLSGIVTIGPNCPVESPNNPCPTPPSAYAERKVQVYSKGKAALLYTVDIDSRGAYYIDLKPADYVVDLKPNGIDKSSDVPREITIKANVVSVVDIKIDTGIR